MEKAAFRARHTYTHSRRECRFIFTVDIDDGNKTSEKAFTINADVFTGSKSRTHEYIECCTTNRCIEDCMVRTYRNCSTMELLAKRR